MKKKQSEYYEKLKDPRWQKLRLQVFERDGWFCCKCGSNEDTLTVHHLVYKPNAEPWDYEPDELITLCAYCHEYEYMNSKQAEQDFLAVIRKKLFFSDDLFLLGRAFQGLKFTASGDVMATFIDWLFNNQTLMNNNNDLYWKYIKKEADKTRGKNAKK